ncbi:hypothetical protein [Streptomyces sp. NBC_01481]|uniref:hypothetical protein n=1 Tax=Streptomyces sp. NBC_01481 TaxID=2975869 RepID=UPI002257AE6B|nr:hypothetical protein [Streptomyces sp. NBC_01481]MCX4583184.1 hypothetical protein [Streptomyces sp. NBC_01481]
MTVDRDDMNRRGMDEHGVDSVMAAVSGEPVPEGAERDPEIAAALADVAVLREQLTFIGDAVAGRTAAPAPVVPVRGRRGRRGRVLALTLAASVAIGTGTAYLVAHNGSIGGGGEDGGGAAKLTAEGLVACSTDIAEGTVARVEPLKGKGGFRVVLDVERSYKSEKPDSAENGGRQLTFTAPGDDSGEQYYRVGGRMLVMVSQFPDEGPVTFREGTPPPGETGEELGAVRDELEYGRIWIIEAIPGARGAKCPGRG